jgi:ligand-binding SRPBCC domain-containing protein
MRIRTFECQQALARPRDEVFAFFADAANLDAITPGWVRFRTVTPAPIMMGEGTLIDHRLRIYGIPLRWRTRINEWAPRDRFVDQQIAGPYRLWIHEHTFAKCDGGTVVGDRVRYAVAFDFAVHRLVRRDIARIFAHRSRMLRQKFGSLDLATDSREL